MKAAAEKCEEKNEMEEGEGRRRGEEKKSF